MKRITLGAIQPPFSDEKSSRANNRIIDAGFELLTEAMTHGATFCCLPEFFNVFGVSADEMLGASSNARELLARTCELARAQQCYVILPMLVGDDGKMRNRGYLIGSEGQVAGHYDKIHTTLSEREDLNVISGNDVACFDTPHGRVAIVICYDVYFPELFVTIARSKPDVIFFPSLQRSDRELANEAMLKTRAMDTQAYIVRSSFGCPIDVPWTKDMMFGQSCIVGPDGTVLANAGHYEGFALASVVVPFVWERPRCGGRPASPVRDFLNDDRRSDVYEM